MPANSTRPAFGTISPVSCPISVVLPAPFGPIMACSSRSSTSSEMLSDATMPPKRLISPPTFRSGSGTALSPEHSVDAAARKQHDQQQHGPKNKLPVFARFRDLASRKDIGGKAEHVGQQFLQHQQSDGADNRAEHRTHAPENDHDDEIAGTRPVHHRGTDEISVIGQ